MRKPLLAAIALVLLATACRAEANFLVDVAEDGSGQAVVELGLDQELLELAEQFSGGRDEFLEAIPEGEELQTRTQGDMTYFSSAENFTDTQDLRDTISFFEDADATVTELDLSVEDGAARLDAVIEAPSVTEAIEGLVGTGLGGFDLGDDFLTSSIIVDLPGSLVESNADEVLSDGRLRWSIPVSGGTVTIHAVTTAGGGGFPWGIVLGVLGALLVAAIAIWLSRRNRRVPVDAIAGTSTPEAPAPLFEESSAEGRSGDTP